MVTIQSLNSTFKRLWKKSSVFEKGFPKKKENYFDKVFIRQLEQVTGKNKTMILFECQSCYKSATLKSALSLLRSPNNHKSQGKKIVACSTTWILRNKLFIHCMVQTKRTTENTKQILQSKPNKYLTLLTRSGLHVESKKILNCKWRTFVSSGN